MRRSYPSDLTDDQWTILEPLIPDAKSGGRSRSVNLREVVNTILYQKPQRLSVGHVASRSASQEHGL